MILIDPKALIMNMLKCRGIGYARFLRYELSKLKNILCRIKGKFRSNLVIKILYGTKMIFGLGFGLL